jgi:hypothetical protein
VFLLSLFLSEGYTLYSQTILLGSDSHLPNHAHLVVQGADVWEADFKQKAATG